MKRIQKLSAPTPGLDTYLICEGSRASWQGFRDHKAGASYAELLEVLRDLQHGLCGYCEINLEPPDFDRQIEHVIPQNDPDCGAVHALDVTNLIICCCGGELGGLYGPSAQVDDERFLAPLVCNRSCGQVKGDSTVTAFVDPRMLPALPSLTRVLPNGKIEVNTDACIAVGIAAAKIKKTIEILGLNVERLRLAREKRWNALNEAWESHFEDHAVMVAAARDELLPNGDGGLPKFFTTNRSYFSPISEEILAECPQEWI